jgi:hypothetical protein
MDLSDLTFPLMYAAFAGIGIALAYVVAGSKIRGWLHKPSVQV